MTEIHVDEEIPDSLEMMEISATVRLYVSNDVKHAVSMIQVEIVH